MRPGPFAAPQPAAALPVIEREETDVEVRRPRTCPC